MMTHDPRLRMREESHQIRQKHGAACRSVQQQNLNGSSCCGQSLGVPFTSLSKSWSPLSSVAQCGGDGGKEKHCNAGMTMLQWSKLSIPGGARMPWLCI